MPRPPSTRRARAALALAALPGLLSCGGAALDTGAPSAREPLGPDAGGRTARGAAPPSATAGALLDEATTLTATDAETGSRFGGAVAGAGDTNGDGFADLVVGAQDMNGASSDSGGIYVYPGSLTGLSTVDEVALTASDGARDDDLGGSVAGGGDLDGDGYADLVAAAVGDDDYGSYTGSVYLWYGSTSGVQASSEQKITASDADSYAYFGRSLSLSGDVDGDGYDDLAVGADGADVSGAAYVFYGSSTGLDAASEQKVQASVSTGYLGQTIELAGDLNGDGYDDLVVGDWRPQAVFVFYGSSTGVDTSTEQRVDGDFSADNTRFGTAVASGGDLDGDGYDDLAVGDYRYSGSETYGGAAYIYLGSSTGVVEASVQEIEPPSPRYVGYFGESLAFVGDLDHDGYDDLLVGAGGGSAATSYSGEGYVFLGSGTGIQAGVGQTVTVSGASAADYVGESVASLGDVDGDGTAEIALGATGNDDAGTRAGAVHIFTGTCSADADGDGFCIEVDCDDNDAAIHPGATETVADGVDSDCDGVELCFVDADDDGHLVDSSATLGSADTDCTDVGEGEATDPTGDCDDTDASVHPGATEGVGDEVDADCDGAETCYADADDDGYTDGSTTVTSADTDCSDAGEATDDADTGDCDDDDATRHPGATETVGDEIDSDCDGAETCYADADDDGYTDGSTTVSSSDEDCADSGEGTRTDPATDCDDGVASTNPGAVELAGDAVDSDCDGAELCYADADDDGHPASTTVASADVDCTASGEGTAAELYAAGMADCDDDDATVFPGATEAVGDGVDSDCDGGERCYADADADGYTDGGTVTSADADCDDRLEATDGTPAGDCDDGDAGVNPGATESPGDGVDSDCDGAELCYVDADDDGFIEGTGSETVASVDADCLDAGEARAGDRGGDCDDTDAGVNPLATELPGDGVDSNCDGTERCFVDADGDGYASDADTVASADLDCEDAGEASAAMPAGGCDDDDAAVSPGAPEEPVGDGVDQDCDGTELCYADADDDGYVDEATTVASADLDCTDPGEGAATDATGDCDDGDPQVNPAALERPDDGLDNDCDGDEQVTAAPDDAVADAPSDDGGKGGCATAGSAPRSWLLLAGLLALVRRRRPPSQGPDRPAPSPWSR